MNLGPGIIPNLRVTNSIHLVEHFLDAKISYNIVRQYKHILIIITGKIFTGKITFDTGVKVKADLLVTPNTDVPLILGTRVMEENKLSIDFHSKQLMMEKESNVVNLQFAYKSEVPRHVHLCKTAAETGLDEIETTEQTQYGLTAETNLTLSCDEELEQICSLAIPDRNQQTDDRRTLLREFRDMFAMNCELGQTHLVQHEIDTGDTLPIKLAPHRLAPGKITVVKKEIDDMLARNIIRTSNSPYSEPSVLVTKNAGSNRMCTDFRRLIEVTKKDAFPLPRIDQIRDHLHGATIFSSLDLASGYWQVPLAESAIPKTAFVIPDGGHYEYLRLLFGLCNAPGTFQRLMTSIFNKYLFSFVLIFLDDVLVFSRNVQEHEKHMGLVFHALHQTHLKLKPMKCRLLQESVTYLGHKRSPELIAPDENKLVAVRDWKRLENFTEVRSSIGFCSYYRRFIKDFAGISKPLHQITKKNSRFTWNPECHNAFEKLKKALIDSSVLKHPDHNSPFIVDTDASDNSLGAVLSNVADGLEYPVAFVSRVLTPAECRYSTTKRDALAVIQAMKWFKPYIWGPQFVLRTDHASLQRLFRQNNDGIIFRMPQRLQDFDFQVLHRPGDKHGNADELSRQCSITPGLTEAERLVMFGSCPSAKSLEDALGRINLVTAEDANEPMSI